MTSRKEQAAEKKARGYNCAQAVACAYHDLVGVKEETLFRLTAALGVGMGTMEGTCGAVNAACILAGLAQAGGRPGEASNRAETMGLAKHILQDFHAQNGAVTCRELKGVETGQVLRPCENCIRDAAGLLERYVFPDSFSETK